MNSKTNLSIRKIASDQASPIFSKKPEQKKENKRGQLATEITALVSASPPELRYRYDISMTTEEDDITLSGSLPLKQFNLVNLIEEEEEALKLFRDVNKKERKDCSFIEELEKSHTYEDDPRQSNSLLNENTLPNRQILPKSRSNSVDLAGNRKEYEDSEEPAAKPKK